MNRIIFASYGNDSIALIEWARGWYEGLTVAYSETGWAVDWWTGRVMVGEAWVREMGYTPVRIPSEGMANLLRRKKAWPRGGGGKYQFCTEALKEAPALAWMNTVDPDKQAICMVGVRREESANRRTFPEWTETSAKHGGRSLHAPLVNHTEAMRDYLISRTPFKPLPYRSKECYPCVNAGKRELRLLDPDTIAKIHAMELEAGTNSKGNERVMFSPARHGGAIGIHAVIADAKHDSEELFTTTACDGGWCE